MKMAKIPKEVFDSSEYAALLTTLSIKDVMVLEFQIASHTKWENMVLCKEPSKKMYLCNVCSVCQYGDKNLYSHLSGKKHICKMEIVKNVRLPKGVGFKNIIKRPPNTQVKPGPVNNAQSPATVAKTTNKSTLATQPNKPPVGVTTKPTATKPQVAATAKPATANPSVATTPKPIATKAPVASTSKPIVAKDPVKASSSNPSAPTTTTKKIAETLPSGSTLKTIEPKASGQLVATNPLAETTSSSTGLKAAVGSSKPIATKVAADDSTKPSVTEASVESNAKPTAANSSTESTSKKSTIIKSQAECIAKTVERAQLASKSTATKLPLQSVPKPTSIEAKSASAEPSIIKKTLAPAGNLNGNSETANEKIISNELKVQGENNPETVKVVNNNDDDDEVILLEPEIATSSKNVQENNKGREKIITPNPMDLKSLPSFTTTFDNSKNMTDVLGLIGVEYVLKIVRSMSDRSPRFLCSLCNISADEISMHNHLISINHRLKYCEEHFPTAIRQYRQLISHVPEHQVFKVLTPILSKLATAIETHHGRENAYHCYEYWFNKNKKSLLSTVFHRRHASEQTGPTFTHVVDSNEVEMFIENANNKVDPPIDGFLRLPNNEPAHPTSLQNSSNVYHSQQPPIQNYTNNYSHQPNNQPHSVTPVDDETHKRMVENFLRDTRQSQPSRHRQSARTSKRNRSRTPSPERKRKRSSPVIASQWDVERRSLSPLRDGDIWQAYRHMVDHSVRELNTSFEVYKSDPEEHPLYKDEWQKFWKRRKDELIASGINHRTYNYQGEWILFFNARLEELYNQDVENIKIKCRERLCLPMTNNELTDTKYHVNVSDYLHEPEIEPLQEPAHIEKTVEHRREPIEHRREPSPPKPKPKPREAREEVNVIHVLRLLTALEDYLGSLGPSITELLAKALQISKVHPEKVNSLILSPENCVVLETAKEKFTGLIISKMLEGNQERALKKAVNDTEALLEFAAELTAHGSNENEKTTGNSSTAGQALSNSYSNQEVAQKTKSTGSYKISDQFDKTELAAKLASSLISQGKTKINPEQLKQIIQVYSLIEQKKLQEPSSSTISAGINSSSITFSSNNSERQQLLNLNPSEQNREQAYNFNSATQNRGSHNLNSDTQSRDSFNSNPAAQNHESYNSSSAVSTRNQFNASSTQQNPKSKLPAQNQQFYNSNSNHDRQTFTNQNQFINSNM
ncbi:hypothetical protein KR215_006696, partial [Drosophila sulfurigaster]